MRSSGEAAAGTSPLVIFGAELRHWRLAAGLSQEQLGDRIGYSGAQVGAVETARRMPGEDFTQRCDAELATDGALARLLDQLKGFLRNQAYPAYFRGWPNVEQEADTLRWWEPMVIPGLLQTEDYARALMSVHPGNTGDRLEELVRARMDRQAVLDSDESPFLWCLVDEGVLHRCVGSPKLMHDQLGHLAGMSPRPQVTVQVVPYSVGAHPGMLGNFVIAGFGDAPSIVYLDTAAAGQIVETPGMVDQVTLVGGAPVRGSPPGGVPRPHRQDCRGEMDVTGAVWRKSSYSGSNGAACVEVADAETTVAVRDSKDPDGPRLAFPAEQWRAFTHQIKTGELG